MSDFFALRRMANESACWEKLYSASSEREVQFWMNELGKLMNESEAVKRQHEQQPGAPGGCVSASPVEAKPEDKVEDEYNGMNGVCCK